MCISPDWFWIRKGPGWEKQERGCRKCWQCLQSFINDYVGRGLCEKVLADWVFVLRLSYRDCVERQSDFAHKVITPRHLQDFVRALRKRGHLFRYLAVGEYGEEKGRAHFHIVLFGTGEAPPFTVLEQNVHIDAWPHGHVYIQSDPDEAGLRYVVKYLFKIDGSKKWHTVSKKPPLAHHFFMEKAARDFALGVVPSRWVYAPPGGNPSTVYYITGASRRNYVLRLLELSGLSPDVHFKNANEWVLKSIAKVDLYMRRRDVELVPMDQFIAMFRDELALVPLDEGFCADNVHQDLGRLAREVRGDVAAERETARRAARST